MGYFTLGGTAKLAAMVAERCRRRMGSEMTPESKESLAKLRRGRAARGLGQRADRVRGVPAGHGGNVDRRRGLPVPQQGGQVHHHRLGPRDLARSDRHRDLRQMLAPASSAKLRSAPWASSAESSASLARARSRRRTPPRRRAAAAVRRHAVRNESCVLVGTSVSWSDTICATRFRARAACCSCCSSRCSGAGCSRSWRAAWASGWDAASRLPVSLAVRQQRRPLAPGAAADAGRVSVVSADADAAVRDARVMRPDRDRSGHAPHSLPDPARRTRRDLRRAPVRRGIC